MRDSVGMTSTAPIVDEFRLKTPFFTSERHHETILKYTYVIMELSCAGYVQAINSNEAAFGALAPVDAYKTHHF